MQRMTSLGLALTSVVGLIAAGCAQEADDLTATSAIVLPPLPPPARPRPPSPPLSPASAAPTAPSPARSGADAPGPWIDMISRIDLQSDQVSGRWRIEQGRLLVDATPGARLMLPWRMPWQYDFEATFRRTSGQDSVALIFVHDGSQASAELDGWGEHLAGIQNIGRRTIRENASRTPDWQLENGRTYTLRVEVRHEGVVVYVDDQVLTSYRGSGLDLSLLRLWELPERETLGLGAWDSAVTFERVRVRAIGSPASMIATRLAAAQHPDFDPAPRLPPYAPPPPSPRSAPTPVPVLVALADPPRGAVPPGDGMQGLVEPFLKQHCLRCHGPQKQQARLRVDRDLPADFTDRVAREKWGEVVNVLNSHEMPPEDEPQPKPADVAAVVDWITRQFAEAELKARDSAIVLRRLNRDEYRNTIRDLVGVDFDPAAFPQDPPAGGFDNNGGALTLSPLHLELYYDAASAILDRALVEGNRPAQIRWRFEPETGDNDSNRVRYDQFNAIVNGGNNPVEKNFKLIHHANWDKGLNARDWAVPTAGDYIIRIRAAGRVPTRKQVVAAAEKFLTHRLQEDNKRNPAGERWHKGQYERDLEHFQTHRMYDYGPPRMRLIQNVGGQPKTLAELDVPAPVDKPEVYEVRARFTTERAGLTVEYAYDIPRELENFWMQSHDNFARPELLVDWFEIEGPVYESWPPPSHRLLLGDEAPSRSAERTTARDLLARFLRRAYRRPVAAEEIDAKLALFDAARESAPSFTQAMKAPLSAVLISPHFLYLVEEQRTADKPAAGKTATGKTAAGKAAGGKAPAASSARALSDHELAARLSYFLWSSQPDAELDQLADAGRLRDPAVLRGQVDRLLADPKAEAFVRNFAGQWLGLREVGANPPAADLYPQYDRHLEISIVGESRAFFAEILKHNLSLANFIDSDFVVINERLARYYGVPDVHGDEFRRVPVPTGVRRGGVLTQASILTTTSNGTRTSPVKRGTWILKNILGADPGLPVANAGEIAPKVPGLDRATVRQRLEVHRTLAQCARCHNKIDPLGFALENFNAAGEWREKEGFGYKGRIEQNDPPIDASSKLPDGTQIKGVEGLQAALMKDRTPFLRCLAGKLYTYALGRELGVADQVQVNAAVAHLQQKNRDTLPELIRFVVASDAFRSK